MAKITIIAEITNLTNQGSDNGKYNKSLKERKEGGFTYVIQITKMITAKITKLTNRRSDTGKYNKQFY